MKYGKLLQLLLEELPPEYQDKFLSYKQLKKRIKSFLASNSLPEAAFEPDVADIAENREKDNVETPSVESTTLRDVKVRWPPVEAEAPAVKKAKSDEGAHVLSLGSADPEEEKATLAAAGEKRKRGDVSEAVAVENPAAEGVEADLEEDDEGALVAAVVAGTKLKGGAGDEEEIVTIAPIEREILAVRQVARRAPQRVGEEKELTKEEEEFLRLLNVELEKFNSFFTEKEEDYVIRLQELKHRLERVTLQNRAYINQRDWNDELLTIRTGLVTFHGEVILMESYSALNYTGLVKILKKHDKRTGAVLRLPFIRRVLLQPFFATELLSKLVQDCENMLSVFPPSPIVESIDVQPVEGAGVGQRGSPELPYPTGNAAGGIFKSTVAALRTLQEMRKGSSTVSAQSLPPCNLNENDERFGMVVN